jgi:hypothetical protein
MHILYCLQLLCVHLLNYYSIFIIATKNLFRSERHKILKYKTTKTKSWQYYSDYITKSWEWKRVTQLMLILCIGWSALNHPDGVQKLITGWIGHTTRQKIILNSVYHIIFNLFIIYRIEQQFILQRWCVQRTSFLLRNLCIMCSCFSVYCVNKIFVFEQKKITHIFEISLKVSNKKKSSSTITCNTFWYIESFSLQLVQFIIKYTLSDFGVVGFFFAHLKGLKRQLYISKIQSILYLAVSFC